MLIARYQTVDKLPDTGCCKEKSEISTKEMCVEGNDLKSERELLYSKYHNQLKKEISNIFPASV